MIGKRYESSFCFHQCCHDRRWKDRYLPAEGAAISSARDKERVDRLRAGADAVMVGGRTLLDEDPKLTVKSEALRAERVVRGLTAKSHQGGNCH